MGACSWSCGPTSTGTKGPRWPGFAIASTPTGSLLPIYIGDDLTDEDAFDAVQFDGIGIVVRHDEDGDRKTAARFSSAEPR